MKKIILGMLALSLLASCSRDEVGTKGDRVIRLNAGVGSVVTRSAPINSGFTADFPTGIYANNGAWLAGAGANWINNDSATVAGAAGHAISFLGGPYYYPEDESTLNIYAFSPYGTETTAAGEGSSPVVTIEITGQEDVMWASTTGYDGGADPTLTYAHKLTQLQFTFVAGLGFPVTGNKVVSLLLKAQPDSVYMVVGTGACTFGGSADMQALSSADQLAGINITTAGTDANSPLITAPASGATAYTIDIVVSQADSSPNITYTGIPVNVTSVAGKAHMITITFDETLVSVTAAVEDWITGDPGTGTPD